MMKGERYSSLTFASQKKLDYEYALNRANLLWVAQAAVRELTCRRLSAWKLGECELGERAWKLGDWTS
jgi:hypothetical protein